MHTLNHSHTNTQICFLYFCKTAHKTHPLQIITSQKGRGGSQRRKSPGPRQIGCLVAHGDGIWQRSVLGRWDVFKLILSRPMDSPIVRKLDCVETKNKALNAWTQLHCMLRVPLEGEGKSHSRSRTRAFRSKHSDVVAVSSFIRLVVFAQRRPQAGRLSW